MIGAQAVAVVGAVLLVAAGIFKIVRPQETVPALTAVGLPARRPLIRGLGLAEVVLGSAVVAAPSPVSLGLLAAAYVGFVAFSAAALRSGASLRSCGCFGKVDTPPSPLHIGINAVIAVAGVAAALSAPALGDVRAAGLGAWLGLAVLSYLVFGMLTALPAAMTTRRPA